jgi:ribosomal protein S12 methylthiotransferase accessory factor YcaO
MEALEFVAAKDAGMSLPSRTGLAAHRTLQLAQNSAFQELVERDAFLYHWLTETPASPCEFLFPFSSELNRVFRPQLVELQSATAAILVFCVASIHPELKCWMIGLGAGPNVRRA